MNPICARLDHRSLQNKYSAPQLEQSNCADQTSEVHGGRWFTNVCREDLVGGGCSKEQRNTPLLYYTGLFSSRGAPVVCDSFSKPWC